MTVARAQCLVRPGFAAVEEAFRANFAGGLEAGAGVSVYHRGVPVVDLWGGVADVATGRPWERDTLAVLTSPTKVLVTAAALLLVRRGVLDLDEPMASYWPEFAARDKAGITLRMVLSHRSGVVTLDHDPITYEGLRAWTPVAAALVAARPQWTPGTAHGYHATTFGHLVGELVRRTTGLTVGRFLARELAGPLGLDCHIGLAADDVPRLAVSVASQAEDLMSGGLNPGTNALFAALAEPSSLAYRVSMGSVAFDGETAGEVARARLESPSYDGVASAPGLARLYAALLGELDGFQLLNAELLDQLRTVHSTGTCRSLLLETTWGLGVMVADCPQFPADAGLATAFGLAGASGAFGFADPEHELAFAYVPNRGSTVIDRLDPRARALVAAVYRSL
jgi:CubicO group peptidase (beta-lactamase class C family)